MEKTVTERPRRRHLNQPGAVTWAEGRPCGPSAARLPGHGNGVRVHSIYFAAVSLTGLLLVLAGVVLATVR